MFTLIVLILLLLLFFLGGISLQWILVIGAFLLIASILLDYRGRV